MDSSPNSYNLHQEIVIDEAIIGYKGSKAGIPTVFIHSKPRSKGFKVYVLADAVSNYIICIRFMTVSAITDRKGDRKTHDLCVDMISHVQGFNHILYTDSFYTSPDLAMTLLNNHHTFLIGSTRPTRKGMPTCLKASDKNPDSKRIKRLERGQFVSRQKGDLVVVVWKDSKLFTALTTCKEGFRTRGERLVRYVKNKESHKRVTYTVPAPEVIENYNQFMGGVDRANQLRAYYTSQRQTHKWW
uniref:Uncharacterized protein LOC102804595 n=1 Tax=Saccoglossus kowalevskii TaxID=10224 RepID=A0ABM0MIF9_SACKO|nr:PREDICTED: uncharacterized protein LOC102804595 [Saccoglossus kowalevskii]